ncbi:hypothetical protein J3A83DRAFT_2068849 [Scleroderma citrinum]
MTSNDRASLIYTDTHSQAISSTFSSPRVPLSRVVTVPDTIVQFRAHSAPPISFPDDSRFSSGAHMAAHESLSTTMPQWFISENVSASSTPISTLREPPQEQPQHIPRPPNAFMLFRSDFLKKRTIPEEVEKRQQNLSRIAGQCWKMLSAEERALWYDRAAAVTAAHHAKYPDYRFRPTRKGAGKHVGKKAEKTSQSDALRGRGHDGLPTKTGGVESSIGPMRRPHIARSYARQSPYDQSISAALREPITLSMTGLPSLSPLSFNASLPVSLDGSANAAAFDDNASQTLIVHRQGMLGPVEQTLPHYSPVFSSGKTLSEMVHELNITPVSKNNHGLPYQHHSGGEKDQMHPTLYPKYSPSPSGLATSTLVHGENDINLWASANPDYSSDKLGLYHTSLLSWLPDSLVLPEQ